MVIDIPSLAEKSIVLADESEVTGLNPEEQSPYNLSVFSLMKYVVNRPFPLRSTSPRGSKVSSSFNCE